MAAPLLPPPSPTRSHHHHRRRSTLLVLAGAVFVLVALYYVPLLPHNPHRKAAHTPEFDDKGRWKPPNATHGHHAAHGSVEAMLTGSNAKGTADNYKTTAGYRWDAEAKMRTLAACIARGDCAPQASNVVIFGAYYCHEAMFNNGNSREAHWCRSMVHSLERQGFTVLIARNDYEYIYHLYRQMPDLVKVVIGDNEWPNGKPEDWFKTDERPDGIPAWKFFRFNYDPSKNGNEFVGNAWAVAAEPEDWRPEHDRWNYTYLGLSLEDTLVRPLGFHDRRARAFILGNKKEYYYKDAAWPEDFFERAKADLRQTYPDFGFLTTVPGPHGEGHEGMPKGIRNVGELSLKDWEGELAPARVMVGLGKPKLSLGAYKALQMSLPFINPHWGDQTDPLQWDDVQHSTLRTEVEPYVYQVKAGDYDGFVRAIRKALEKPMLPKHYARMTDKALDRRMYEFVHHDWKHAAEVILEKRKSGVETQSAGKLFVM
ncbi:hypothetical protein Q8F55_002697 [Vanrija albida]|uniref:Alpha-1,6-mannosyl-glycoprotein 6-beta-N-acetylglucosaminyltransferase n=1 Tax=Vanrija albida TaxID=181172 RepID=A0ABR3QAI7_9TREE